MNQRRRRRRRLRFVVDLSRCKEPVGQKPLLIIPFQSVWSNPLRTNSNHTAKWSWHAPFTTCCGCQRTRMKKLKEGEGESEFVSWSYIYLLAVRYITITLATTLCSCLYTVQINNCVRWQRAFLNDSQLKPPVRAPIKGDALHIGNWPRTRCA